jgi:N-acetylglucosaminyldiphosphoundecaprenol N-acetyl-beta-D-mannosaminyltransferase
MKLLESSNRIVASVETDWPDKCDVFGVGVTPTTYEEAVDRIVAGASRGESAVVSLHAVHAVVSASCDPELRDKVNAFQMVAPDGQPVRWALNRLYGAGLRDRVYGPELMLRVCQRAAADHIPIYLYGSSPEVIERLEQVLPGRFAGLNIVGAESPPFRQLTPREDEATVQRINESGAGIVFLGLGCPKQDHFAYDHRDEIHAVQVCVGAAFDFHAGVKRMSPAWMQRHGLEWLFRLFQEPRRLWRRYLITNTLFLGKLSRQWARQRLRLALKGIDS